MPETTEWVKIRSTRRSLSLDALTDDNLGQYISEMSVKTSDTENWVLTNMPRRSHNPRQPFVNETPGQNTSEMGSKMPKSSSWAQTSTGRQQKRLLILPSTGRRLATIPSGDIAYEAQVVIKQEEDLGEENWGEDSVTVREEEGKEDEEEKGEKEDEGNEEREDGENGEEGGEGGEEKGKEREEGEEEEVVVVVWAQVVKEGNEEEGDSVILTEDKGEKQKIVNEEDQDMAMEWQEVEHETEENGNYLAEQILVAEAQAHQLSHEARIRQRHREHSMRAFQHRLARAKARRHK